MLWAKDDGQNNKQRDNNGGQSCDAGSVAAVSVALAVSDSNSLGPCPVNAFVLTSDSTAAEYTLISFHCKQHSTEFVAHLSRLTGR